MKTKRRKFFTICLVLFLVSVSCQRFADVTQIGQQFPSNSTSTATIQAPDPTPTIEVEPTPEPLNTGDGRNVFGVFFRELTPGGGIEPIAQAGVSWTARDFPWNIFEPNPGDRRWTDPVIAAREQEFKEAKSRSFEIIFILDFTPAWAIRPGFNCGVVDEKYYSKLGDLMYDLVKRYSAPPYNITFYQISNEPDAAGAIGCWGDAADLYYGGGRYGEMLKVVYPRLKEANPHAKLMVGGLLMDCDPVNPVPDLCTGANEYKTRSTQFFEGILRVGGGNAFDGVAFHAYDYYRGEGVYGGPNWKSDSRVNGPAFVNKAAYLRNLMKQYQVKNKFLLSTEVAMLCGRDGSEEVCQTPEHEATLNAYIVQVYSRTMVEGLVANMWFYAEPGWRGAGLLNPDLTPKPACYTMAFAQKMLGGSRFIRQIPVENQPNLIIYEFDQGSQLLWVVWSKQGESSFNLPDGLIKVYNLTGQEISLPSPGWVNWQPLYLEIQK